MDGWTGGGGLLQTVECIILPPSSNAVSCLTLYARRGILCAKLPCLLCGTLSAV